MAIDLERTGKTLQPARRRGIYLLPNIFTTLNLFAGFYAIVQGMNHEFEKAAIAIFVAMVLDSIDGRVARLTRTQSAFGAQYDSLADMVSFGAAPALVMYEWALRDMGRAGWVAAFVYCVGAALRLARPGGDEPRADRGRAVLGGDAISIAVEERRQKLAHQRLIDGAGAVQPAAGCERLIFEGGRVQARELSQRKARF